MFRTILNFFTLLIYYIFGILLSAYCTYLFYLHSPYPFQSYNILYYFSGFNFFFFNELFSNILTYIISLFCLGIVYLVISKKNNLGRILNGVISAVIIFLIYLTITFLFTDLNQINDIKIYLIQDFIGLNIYYLVLSIVYKNKRIKV